MRTNNSTSHIARNKFRYFQKKSHRGWSSVSVMKVTVTDLLIPDAIEDDWIETVEKLYVMLGEYIHLRKKAGDVFEMRYQDTIDPDRERWELCSRVLARRDVIDRLSTPW